MKKSKLSTGLVTSFIAAMALSACNNNLTSNKENIVSFTGYNDQSLAVVTNDLYNDYLNSSSGISSYYNSVIEVLIRKAFQDNEKGTTKLEGLRKTYSQIVNEAKNNVKGDKATAKKDAETNGTSYKTEWQSVLKSKGVEDESELLQYYIYQLEKEVIEDWYFDQHEEELTKEYLGVSDTGTSTATTKAASRFPYHIRHILVKVEDGASDFTRGTISAAQATLLSDTIKLLAEGKLTFGEVAAKKSEDSSGSSYGDVGLMTAAASSGSLGMVNEFQLGIYAYDAVLSGDHAANEVISKGLGLSGKISKQLYEKVTGDNTLATSEASVSDTLTELGLDEVPYSKVIELGEAAELDSNASSKLKVEDGVSALYPRNILWNKYFNKHNAFVITNRTPEAYYDVSGNDKTDAKADVIDLKTSTGTDTSYVLSETVKKYDDATKTITIDYSDATGLKGFKANTHLSSKANFKVLSDENSNVIIGVRSQYGIHLMVVQKSAYDFNTGEGNDVSLEQYYTTAVPGDADYPKDANGKDKTTYVNFIQSVNKSEYNTRANTVRSAIKGFDTTYDYRLYEELSSAGNEDARKALVNNDENSLKLLSSIDNYIALQREKNNNDQEEGIAKVWRTYLELLSVQANYRSTIQSTDDFRIIPEGCKIRFYDGQDGTAEGAEYKEGGVCYVKN